MIYLILLILALIVLGSLSFWYYNVVYCKVRYMKNIPGPNLVPLIGNALEFRKPTEILQTFTKFTNIYGGIFRTVIGFDVTVTITDYAMIEKIHSSVNYVEKSKFYNYLQPWLGTGLLTAKSTVTHYDFINKEYYQVSSILLDPKWRRHRKLLTPTFHFKILEQFIETFNGNTDIFIEQISKYVDRESLDIYPYALRFALDTICETAMGTSINSQTEINSDYVESVKEMSRIMQDRIFSPVEQFDFLFQFTKNGKLQKQYLTLLHDFTRSVIKERREFLNNNNSDESEDFSGKRKLAFLDLLLLSDVDGKKLTDDEIREEVDTFMFEGHDTIASAIGFTLFCLSTSNETQNKVLEELDNIYGNYTKKLNTSMEDLKRMKYLECVIRESLRLFPSVPFYARSLTEDLTLNDGSILKKDTSINIFAYGVHKNPDFYPNPDLFNPDRFLPENNKNKGQFPYSFLPFSAGPRNCIGQTFAMLEMKAVLSKFLQEYKIMPAEPKYVPVLTADAVLKPVNGIRIKIIKRIN